MEEQRLLIKTCSRIMRKTQSHLDSALKPYGLTSGSYPYLLTLSGEEGINQDRISKKLGVDKAMSARTIQKLIHQGYLTKVPDETDSRAFRLYLTDRARSCLPEILREIEQWIGCITEGLTNAEKNTVVRLLMRIAENADQF